MVTYKCTREIRLHNKCLQIKIMNLLLLLVHIFHLASQFFDYACAVAMHE